MKRLHKFLISAATLVVALALFAVPAYADLTISSATQFSTLDGGVNDADGLANGCFVYAGGNFTVSAAGSILNNDPASPSGNDAGNICANVTAGGILLQGAVKAENLVGGGSGGNIQLTASGDITLQSTATISSSKTSGAGDTGHAGNITLTATGASSDITIATGATVKADSTGPSGSISITAPRYITINGTVSSGISGAGTTVNKGGPISIKSGCTLTIGDTGVVSSKGRDPGADLVHLEGCDVNIFGLVESTGPGHAASGSRLCYDADGPGGNAPTRPDKPSNSTACVEIWAGGTLTIDSTGTHNGQINVDTGTSGGTQGLGWADLFARKDVVIIGDASGPFAVHANQTLGNGHGGVVTVTSLTGNVTASGLALQAEDPAAGGNGGVITVQADDNVVFNNASVFARGHSPATFGTGGKVDLRSFNGSISWQNGVGDVTPTGTNASLSAAKRGTITFQDCVAGAVNTTGTTFPNSGSPATTPTTLADACGGAPTLASYVALPPVCTACTTGSLHILKFVDTDGDGTQDAGEGPQATVTFTVTGPNGYSFTGQTNASGEILLSGLLPGSYTITETVPGGFHATTSSTQNVAVVIGAQSSVTFGNQKDVGSLHILKFKDDNGDGSQQGGENPLAGVSFTITGPNGYSNTVQTDANGEISLLGLDAGTYTATETVPSGFSPTTLTVQDGVVTNGNTAELNFGNKKDVGSLHILKFIDENGNATQDGSEGPQASVTFTVTGPNGYSFTGQTDGSGEILLSGLDPGSYTITETVPGGFHATTSSTQNVSVTTNNQADATFGNQEDVVEPETGGLRIFKFIDTDGNGAQGAGEGPQASVTFTVTGPNGYSFTGQTDAGGEIVLANLEPGSYTAAETVPGGFHATTSSTQNVTVTVNSQVSATFGNQEDVVEPTPTPTPTPVIEQCEVVQECEPTPTPEATPGQQASPDPSASPGVSAINNPSGPSPKRIVAPTSFADTGGFQAALPGLVLLTLGGFSIRRWRRLRR